jgi:DNA primase
LKRYPNGVEGEHFYEKRCPTHRPSWVRTAAIWSDRRQKDVEYCQNLRRQRTEVYVPLNTPVTYERTKALSHSLAQGLEADAPRKAVSKMAKSLRGGKVLWIGARTSGSDTRSRTSCCHRSFCVF